MLPLKRDSVNFTVYLYLNTALSIDSHRHARSSNAASVDLDEKRVNDHPLNILFSISVFLRLHLFFFLPIFIFNAYVS